MMAAKVIANPARAIAIHCQSTSSLSETVKIDMTANDAAPKSIQIKGSTAGGIMDVAGNLRGGKAQVYATGVTG